MYKIIGVHRSFFGEISLADVEVWCDLCDYKRVYSVSFSDAGVEKANSQFQSDHVIRQHSVDG